jgi:hypothetical protein
VSILVEIAAQADVSVEGVVRVLTREPVSDVVKQRVLAVLDELSPAQTRVVERFALASVHDVFPSEDEQPGEENGAGTPFEETALALPPGHVVRRPVDGEPPEQRGDAGELREADMLAVRLVTLLEELVGAITDLKAASSAERRERVDDLAVLVDLITTGWQGVDRRLGRVERVVSRLEPDRRPPPISARRVEPSTPEAAPEEPPEAEEAPAEPERAEPERRWPAFLTVAVLSVSAVFGFLALLDLLPSRHDLSRLIPDSASASSASSTADLPLVGLPPGPLTATGTNTEAPATVPPPLVPTTTTKHTTTASSTAGVGPAATHSTPTTTRATTTTTRATTTTKAATKPRKTVPGAIQPARNWAWAPVPKATYYTIEFLRGTNRLYRTVASRPRLTLPGSVVFSPGAYRWIVRPGFGTRAENRLGRPVVDSTFTVA